MPDTHGNSVVDNMAATVGGSKTAKLVAGIDMTNRLQRSVHIAACQTQ